MSKDASSPMELGEIESSPDLQSNSPQIEIDLEDGSQHQPANRNMDVDRTDEAEDALNIQPPQLKVSRREKHKHRHRNKKAGRHADSHADRHSRDVFRRADHAAPAISNNERERSRGGAREGGPRDDGAREARIKEGGSKEGAREGGARETGTREGGAREGGAREDGPRSRDHDRLIVAESENDRRAKSQAERERLERLERERHMLERERSQREREYREKMKAEQEQTTREQQQLAESGSRHRRERGERRKQREELKAENQRKKEKSKKTRKEQSSSRTPPPDRIPHPSTEPHPDDLRNKLLERRQRANDTSRDRRGDTDKHTETERHREPERHGEMQGDRDRQRNTNRNRDTDRQKEHGRERTSEGDKQREGRQTGRHRETDRDKKRQADRGRGEDTDSEVEALRQKALQKSRNGAQDEYVAHRSGSSQEKRSGSSQEQQLQRTDSGRGGDRLKYQDKPRHAEGEGSRENEQANRGRSGVSDRERSGVVENWESREAARQRDTALQRGRERGEEGKRGTQDDTKRDGDGNMGRAETVSKPETDLRSRSSSAGSTSSSSSEAASVMSSNSSSGSNEVSEGKKHHDNEAVEVRGGGGKRLKREGDTDSIASSGKRRRSVTVSSESGSEHTLEPHRSKYDDDDDDDYHGYNNLRDNRNRGRSHSSNSSHSTPLGAGLNDELTDRLSDSPVPSSPEIGEPRLPAYYPALQGCRNVEEFNCLNRIEEGTYGVVYRAVDRKTEEIVALKRLKMEKEKEGFPITSLREINTLLKAQHPNIVTVREIVVGSNMDKIYIVMDYVEHDLKSLMESMKEPFMIGEVKTLLKQLLRGVAHLHDNWIIHRDLKTSNLLLSHKGILKIGDFGLAREYGSPLKCYTPIVVTLWYRAPELLLCTKQYSTPIDMWSVGCIFAEFITRKPLFPGRSDIDELNRIFKELGTPNEKIWPGVSELPAMKKCTFTEYPYNQLRSRFGSVLSDKGFDLMNRFLTYCPLKRVTAEEALKHEFFAESPYPVDPSMFPTWPAKSEMSRTRSHGNSPKPPSGGKAYANLLADDDESGGFHLGADKGAGFSLKF